MSYLDYCKDFIKDELDCYKGTSYTSVWELSCSLTQVINGEGSATRSTFEAKELIGEWFVDLCDFVDYYNDYYDDLKINIFEEPERFHSLAVIFGVNQLLLASVHDNDITLDDNTIEYIISQLENIEDFGWE